MIKLEADLTHTHALYNINTQYYNINTHLPDHSCWFCQRAGCPLKTPRGKKCNGPLNGLLWPSLVGAGWNIRIKQKI